MAVGCFAGRGSLLVSVLGASRGFFTLSGESEITVDFQEDNESIIDARNGVNERVDWFVRNYRLTVTAQCFRLEPKSIELLLKSAYSQFAGSAADIVLPNPVTIGEQYILRPNITPGSLSVTSPAPAVLAPSTYNVDLTYGLIDFISAIPVQPYTVHLTTGAYESFALNARNQVFVSAMLKGIDIANNREVLAHFYRLALDISEELKLVQLDEFTSMSVRMQATPDTSQPIDPLLGQYGRLIFL